MTPRQDILQFAVLALVALSKTGRTNVAIVHFPELKMNARYKSSGDLVGQPAVGEGEFYSTLGDIKATVTGTISTKQRDGQDFLHLERLNIDEDIKTVDMEVRNVFNSPIIKIK
ncbi:hypothetical protein C0J52_04725 [Blattella germanica]|nr:hypothetical protein C0J52_04725 [Blattella germanica]